MSNWNWLWEWERTAREDGDFERLRLPFLLLRAESISHERPDEKFAAFEEGRVQAAHLGEKWWEMVFNFWKVQTLLYKKQDPRGALDLAARLVVETRKPFYDGFPQKAAIALDLVACYIRLDPLGYRPEIERALADARQNRLEAEDDRYFAQIETRFLWSIESPQAAQTAWDYLRLADEDDSDHHAVFALTYLCGTLYDFDKENAKNLIGALSERGFEVARSEQRERLETNFLMWQAVAARWKGRESDAQNLYRFAIRRNALHARPRNGLSHAAKAFHEIAEEWELALRVCQWELREIRGHDLDFEEASWRLEKLKLLQKCGKPTEREKKCLRRVAAKLRSKAHWEAQMEAF